MSPRIVKARSRSFHGLANIDQRASRSADLAEKPPSVVRDAVRLACNSPTPMPSATRRTVDRSKTKQLDAIIPEAGAERAASEREERPINRPMRAIGLRNNEQKYDTIKTHRSSGSVWTRRPDSAPGIAEIIIRNGTMGISLIIWNTRIDPIDYPRAARSRERPARSRITRVRAHELTRLIKNRAASPAAATIVEQFARPTAHVTCCL